MKSLIISLIAIAALAACSSPQDNSGARSATGSSKPPPVKHQVWEPDVGVICDRVDRRCYTDEGPSVAQTERFMGAAAAERLTDEIRRAGGSWDPTEFTFSDGVMCNTINRKCYLNEFDDEPARAQTKSLFAEYKRRYLFPRKAAQQPPAR